MDHSYSIQAQGQRVEVRIIGEIAWWENDADTFIRKMDEAKASGASELLLYINSPGGDVFEANEIVNQIKGFPGRKIGKAGALCASAATVILRACDETMMARNGQFMIHNPWTRAQGDSRALRSRLQLLENLQTQMAEGYATGSNISQEEAQTMMDAETWMTAAQAVERGLVGRIADEDDTLPAMSADVLSRFSHAPQPVLNAATQPGAQAPQNQIPEIMKDQLTEVLGLNPSATEAQIVAAVNKAKQEAADARKELADFKAQAAQKAAETLVDAAIEAKKIPATERDTWIADAKANHDLVARTLARLQAPVQLSAATQSSGPATSAKPSTWDEYMERDPQALADMRDKDPAAYTRLYEAKYGLAPQF